MGGIECMWVGKTLAPLAAGFYR